MNNDYDINNFIEMVALGELSPSQQLEIRNMSGNQVQYESFEDHCRELCKRHNTNMLRLLSVIQQKINGDMIIRLGRSPIFETKVKQIMNEWGHNDIAPTELFQCPNNCYDTSRLDNISDLLDEYNQEFESIENNIESNNSNLYDNIISLKDKFHTCGERIQSELIDVEDRLNEYNPKYQEILCDLSTRHKPFYLEDMIEEDKAHPNIVLQANKKINRHIPDKLPKAIESAAWTIPTMINKEMERCKQYYIIKKDDIVAAISKLTEISEKLGPENQLSGLLDF